MLNYLARFFILLLFSLPRANEYFVNESGDCTLTDNKIYSANYPANFRTQNECLLEVRKNGWLVTTELTSRNLDVIIGRNIYPSAWTHSLDEPIDDLVYQYDKIQIIALSDNNAGAFVFEFFEEGKDECNESELHALFDKIFYVETDCSSPLLDTDGVCSCLATIEPRETERFNCIWSIHDWNPKHVTSVASYCREECLGTACSCDLDVFRSEIPVWVSNYGSQVEEPCNHMIDSLESGTFTDQIVCGCFNEIPEDLSYVLGCRMEALGVTFATKAKECRGYRDPTIAPTPTLPSNFPTATPSTSFPSQYPSSNPTPAFPSHNPTNSPSTPQPSHTPTTYPTPSLPSISPSISSPSLLPSALPTASEPSSTPSTAYPSSHPSTRPSLSSPSTYPSSTIPSNSPSMNPTACPTRNPLSSSPSGHPSTLPSVSPSSSPETTLPSIHPTTTLPSSAPSSTEPSFSPSVSSPSTLPSYSPSISFPSATPTISYPSTRPTSFPTSTVPSSEPTSSLPSASPSECPTAFPSLAPSPAPIFSNPSVSPSNQPTPHTPTVSPSVDPTKAPSFVPSIQPTSDSPSTPPTSSLPSLSPSSDSPSVTPSSSLPTFFPTTTDPTKGPSTSLPTGCPSVIPTKGPSPTSPSAHPSVSPSETLYVDQIILDESFSVVANVTVFISECTAFLRTIPAVTKVACRAVREGSIIIDIEGPDYENELVKDYVDAFGMSLPCCGELGGPLIQTSVVVQTSLVEVEALSSEGEENVLYTYGMYGLAAALALVIITLIVWCWCCRSKPHVVKFLDDKDRKRALSESLDILTDFEETKREPMSTKRQPRSAKRQPETLTPRDPTPGSPGLHALVMENVSQAQVDLTPRKTLPGPPDKSVDYDSLEHDLPQDGGAEYEFDDEGGASMRLLPLIDRELEEALEFDPEFVYLKDQIASLLGQAAKFEPGAIRSQWEAQAQFSKDALIKLCRLRFGDERTDNYKPRLERIWRETGEVARRLSVTSVRGLFFKFFDISNNGDITHEEFNAIAQLVLPGVESYAVDETFRFIDTSNRGSFTPIEIQTFLDKQWGGRARRFRKAVIDYMSSHSIQETQDALEPKLKRRPEIELEDLEDAGITLVGDNHVLSEEELNIEDTEDFGKSLLEKMKQLRRDMDNRRLSSAFNVEVDDEDNVRLAMQQSGPLSDLIELDPIQEQFIYLEMGDQKEPSVDLGFEKFDIEGLGKEPMDLNFDFDDDDVKDLGTEPVDMNFDFDDQDLTGIVNFESDSEELSSLERDNETGPPVVMKGMHASRLSTGSFRQVDFDADSEIL